MRVRLSVYRDFVADLASLLRAGIPVAEALENLASATSGARGYRGLAGVLLEKVRERVPLAEALAWFPSVVPAVDVALVRAGETSGKLDEVFQSIVDRLDASLELRRDLLQRSAYSIVLLLMIVVLMPLSLAFTGRSGSYALMQLGFFFVVAVIVWVVRRSLSIAAESPLLSDSVERVIFAIPWWGTQQKKLALAGAFEVVGLVLEAGLTFGEAISLAASTIRWPTLRRSMMEAGTALEAGSSVDDAFGGVERYLGGPWRQRLAAAYEAGHSDRGFLEVSVVWKSEFRRSLEQCLKILPIIVLLIVGGIVLSWALSTIGGIYDNLLSP